MFRPLRAPPSHGPKRYQVRISMGGRGIPGAAAEWAWKAVRARSGHYGWRVARVLRLPPMEHDNHGVTRHISRCFLRPRLMQAQCGFYFKTEITSFLNVGKILFSPDLVQPEPIVSFVWHSFWKSFTHLTLLASSTHRFFVGRTNYPSIDCHTRRHVELISI